MAREVEVLVRTHDRTRKSNVVFPLDYTTTKVIREACDYFGMPAPKNGNYAIRHDRTATILQFDDTLEESGIRNSDILEVIIEHGEGARGLRAESQIPKGKSQVD